jgi:hypothetical protein
VVLASLKIAAAYLAFSYAEVWRFRLRINPHRTIRNATRRPTVMAKKYLLDADRFQDAQPVDLRSPTN